MKFLCGMSLVVASIASGSNGNCYFIGNEIDAILVDVGISCKEVEKRMKRMGLSMQGVKAIFISHEHSDHICGLAITARRYAIPVYITAPTLRNGRTFIPKAQIHSFTANEIVRIGDLKIMPFSKQHDAADPYSFTITYRGVTVGVFTDIGLPCTEVTRHFAQCHAVFLETNYDEDMLMKGAYPYFLKMRIHGDHGHLSNAQALQLFKTHKSPALSHLFLSHLSKNNNKPELVKELFTQHADGVEIIVASRYEESAMYTIRHERLLTPPPTFIKAPPPPQLAFSFD